MKLNFAIACKISGYYYCKQSLESGACLTYYNKKESLQYKMWLIQKLTSIIY